MPGAARVCGAVLTGGASRRMGRDKALIEIDGHAMASRVATALAGAGCDPVVAVGGDPVRLAELGLPVVPDAPGLSGPLAGILGAMDRFADDASPSWVLVVACDLPHLSPEALRPLIAATVANPGADVVVGRTDRVEPMVAAWRVAASADLRAIVAGGERAVHRVLERLATVGVAIDPAAVRNINTPGDLPRYP